MKVLFNDCYGMFCFSVAFVEEYKRRFPADWKQFISDLDQSHWARRDPNCIALFEERGSEWCSGIGSMLQMVEIPEVFAEHWEIEDYDGNETVRIMKDSALAAELHRFIGGGDVDALRAAYKRIMETDTALVSGIGLLDALV
jgi:hypothetical protein